MINRPGAVCVQYAAVIVNLPLQCMQGPHAAFLQLIFCLRPTHIYQAFAITNALMLYYYQQNIIQWLLQNLNLISNENYK